MYRKSIPIIWHHLLDVKDVNLQLPLELWRTVAFSTEPVSLPVCKAESSQAEKEDLLIFPFFTIKMSFFFP